MEFLREALRGGNRFILRVAIIAAIGELLGAVISGWTSERVGRRWTKVGSGSVYVIGALRSALAPDTEWLIIATPVNLALGDAWRWMLGLTVIPGAGHRHALHAVLAALADRAGPRNEARQVLARSRPEEDIDDELSGVREAAEREAWTSAARSGARSPSAPPTSSSRSWPCC